MQEFDLFVIGGGSGGVRCARIAASLGARVGIAESRFWGGTCVNVGCVPKKILVQGAEYAAHAADARGFGWHSEPPRPGFATLMATKDAEIARLNAVYVKLLRGAGAEIFDAHATFLDAHTLDVGGEQIRAKHIVIATGGHPTRAAIPGAEHAVLSDDLFTLTDIPKRVAILGAGYIAVEFAGIFAGFGAHTDLIYRGDLPLRGFDHDIRTALAEALEEGNICLHPGQAPTAIAANDDGSKTLSLSNGTHIHADLILFATGRAPNTRGLGLAATHIATDTHGRITVDAEYRTNHAHIYAIGDVSNKVNLTPVAIAEGHILAERLFGEAGRSWNFSQIPTAVFSSPPIATCGLSEADAQINGPVDIYLTRFTPMRHSISGRKRRTVMKLVVDQASQKVVGAHMLGDDAPEMMQAIGVAMTAGATKHDFDRTIGIHPTAAEEWVTMRTRTRTAG